MSCFSRGDHATLYYIQVLARHTPRTLRLTSDITWSRTPYGSIAFALHISSSVRGRWHIRRNQHTQIMTCVYRGHYVAINAHGLLYLHRTSLLTTTFADRDCQLPCFRGSAHSILQNLKGTLQSINIACISVFQHHSLHGSAELL